MDRPPGGWSDIVTNQTLDLKIDALEHELRASLVAALDGEHMFVYGQGCSHLFPRVRSFAREEACSGRFVALSKP